MCAGFGFAVLRKSLRIFVPDNEFPVIVSSFARKDLPADICKKIFDKLGYDDLKVLYYLGRRFSATFDDILEDVDDDEDDMHDALNTLMGIKLVFKHEDYYFCKISRKSIKLTKKNERRKEHDSSSLDICQLFGQSE